MPSEPGVRITKVAVENMGPLGSRTLDFGRFNVLYGRNESGKTYLVEFLLRSLFRNSGEWPLRPMIGGGKVYLNGLEGEETVLSPETKTKLEDLWQENRTGLPPNMARLLVVKGGELELDGRSHGGADRRVLKSVLSSEDLLEQLAKSMQATVRDAELREGKIIGANRGLLRDRMESLDELKKLDRLIEEVQVRLSDGAREQLRRRRQRIQSELDAMQQAKEHRAFALAADLESIQGQREKLPAEKLTELQESLRERHHLKERAAALTRQLEEYTGQARHFKWLEQAVKVWQQMDLSIMDEKMEGISILGIVGLVSGMVIALASSFLVSTDSIKLVLVALGILVFLTGLVGLIIYLRRQRRAVIRAARAAERDSIRLEFQQRFERDLAGLVELQAELEAEREASLRIEHIREDLGEVETELKIQRETILNAFTGLMNKPPDSEYWEEALQELIEERDQLDQAYRELELALERLGIPPDRFQSTPSEVEYEPGRLEELERDLLNVERELASAEQDLAALKAEISRKTDAPTTASWEELLASLFSDREAAESKYRQITSQILAQMALNRVLEEIKAQEDEKIREGLSDVAVREALEGITGRYSAVQLDDDRLFLHSETASYALAELSTGAQEQVLLALRLGFASQLAAGDPLFLLLDDAFQYSDWERRKRLVVQMVEVARAGWQVIYLTMDDHLRDLLCEQGKRSFKESFAAYDLG